MKKQNLFKNILSFTQDCHKHMIFSVVFAVLSVTSGFIPYFGVYKILTLFFSNTANTPNVLLWSAVCIVGYVLKILCYGISTTLSHISAYKILENIRLALTTHLMKVPLGEVLSRTAGNIKSIIVDKVETIELPIAHMIPEGISNLLLPIVIFIYLIIIDWRMALCSLITVPLATLIYSIMMKNYNTQYADYMAANNHVNSIIVEYVEGIEVIKAFNQSSSSYSKFKVAVSDFKEYTLTWFRSTWKLMTLGGAILPSTLLGILPIGLLFYTKNSLTPAALTMCIILSLGIVAPLSWFTTFVNEYKAVEYAISEVNSILTIPEIDDANISPPINDYGITLTNISFSYNETSGDVLHDISLTIPPGKFTALCGPSGGGKSTIARLIARFWDVNTGNICIGGVNIKEIPLEELTQLISYVTQDNFLFNCSLLENIRLGCPTASDREVYEAAKAAQCHDFISQLEDGYNTEAGEAGSKLSGGECQRIAIARAILKNAPIVILDEASAFTDPENENKLQLSIASLTKGKTLLVIAHRLSTIKDANQIVLVKNGIIADSGCHEDLLSNCQLYDDMWQAHIGAKQWAAGQTKEVSQ